MIVLHPTTAVLAGAVILALIVGGVVLLVAGWRARTEAGAAVAGRDALEALLAAAPM